MKSFVILGKERLFDLCGQLEQENGEDNI